MGRSQAFPGTPTVPAVVVVIWCVRDYHSVEEQAKVAKSLEFGFWGDYQGSAHYNPGVALEDAHHDDLSICLQG